MGSDNHESDEAHVAMLKPSPGEEKISNTEAEQKKPFLKRLTVEPILLPYIVACVLVNLTNQNLNIQKACRVNLDLSKRVCASLDHQDSSNSSDTSELQVQKLVANMLIWQTILQNSIPTVFVIFLGSWSDRNRRRRPCMLLPLYGELIKNIGLFICVYFFDELPMQVSGLWQSLPIALTGYWVVMFMAVFSYVGDISTLKDKTMRVGLVNLTVAISLPIGTAFSGILYRKLGFYGVYGISSILCIISIYFAYTFVEDKNPVINSKENKGTYWSRIKFFFDLKHIIEAFRVSFKKEKNHRRLKVIVLTILITTIMGPLQGEKGVSYLFTRIKFNWTEMEFSIFSTFSMVINLIGTSLVLGVVIKKYGADDALVGIVASIGKFVSQIVFALAGSEVVYYFAAAINFLQGPAIISQKSIVNKIIPAEELGQVTAVTSIGENLVPVFCGPLYSAIYEATVDYFPGAYFLLTASITLITIVNYAILYVLHRQEIRAGIHGEYTDPNPDEQSNGVSTIKYGSIKPSLNGIGEMKLQ
ncbi:solute carrier family 46 member 3-like [Adelges cooleyi]|uniref:solute carrier family 46 member 3-like n=1 Tax=Adelges cooleyi TaxID=133065 RepID=UPI002180777F|nr:solute carrier family 46 member 3-like [Adelges cooleyi]